MSAVARGRLFDDEEEDQKIPAVRGRTATHEEETTNLRYRFGLNDIRALGLPYHDDIILAALESNDGNGDKVVNQLLNLYEV